jgi:hypothetical protein
MRRRSQGNAATVVIVHACVVAGSDQPDVHGLGRTAVGVSLTKMWDGGQWWLDASVTRGGGGGGP